MRSVDSDTHFLEPMDLWDTYADPAWRHAAPRFVQDGERVVLLVDGRRYPASSAHSGFGSLYRADGTVRDHVWELHSASIDATRRLGRMDRTSTAVEIVYPTVAMAGMHAIDDAEHAAAHARAYNRFAADATSPAPDRLRAAMIVPLNHPEHAERELVHARAELGLNVLLASFGAPQPFTLSSPDLDRVWAAAADLDVTVTFQDSSLTSGSHATGLARATTWRMLYLAAHVVEAQLGLADLVLGGVLDRHPTLRVGMQETHLRWLPGWLALLDDRFPPRRAGGNAPSQAFRRQCFVAAFPDEPGVREVVDAVGSDNLVFSSDWPHRELAPGNDSDWVRVVEARDDLTPDERARGLDSNPRRWFAIESV